MILTQRAVYRKVITFATSVFGLYSFLGAAFGCPYSIRDAGFIVREPRPYTLTVFVSDRTPAKDNLAQWLTAAADKYLLESNVEAEVVNIDHPPNPSAITHLESLGTEDLPAAILISPRDKAISLPSLGRERVSEEAVQELVRQVVVSPKRAELVRHIIADWCVVILAEGTDMAENLRVAQAIAGARNTVVGTSTEMGQRIEKSPYLITLSPADVAERVFMWSIGLAPDDKTQTRLAVLFGMGRRIGPVLTADKISESMLTNIFLLLGRNCTCTTDPGWLLGPAAPLVWGEKLQRQVYDTLGFDPNNPAVAATLAGAWTSLRTMGSPDSYRNAEGENTECSSPLPLSPGYIEFSVGPDGGEMQGAIDMDSATPTIEQHSLRIVIGLTVVLVLIALGGGAVLLLRQRKAR